MYGRVWNILETTSESIKMKWRDFVGIGTEMRLKKEVGNNNEEKSL